MAAIFLVAFALLLGGVLGPANGSEPAKPLLPNLVADPPDNMVLAAESESAEGSNGDAPPQLLLRFDGYVHNVGPGALDFRGSRAKPALSRQTEKEVEIAEENREPLSSPSKKTEEELATPPMTVTQRLFLPLEGKDEAERQTEETNVDRPAHVEEASGGEMIYVNADGHHHWHLQKVAKYSLWNSTKTAEVAPAQKVGFCLEDSQHVELDKGPKTAAYADNVPPYREFCQQYHPDATSVYEGVSPGWRDVYSRELAFQWVNVSNVLPGEYWLREDVNPLGVIDEVGGANEPAYATTPTIVPGYDALAQSLSTEVGKVKSVTLSAEVWRGEENGEREEKLPGPTYAIVEGPAHGTLTAITGDQVTYLPEPGYSGPDSFVFSASDPNSPFPTSPARATVSISVGGLPQPSLSIAGAPAAMLAGTSVTLGATVAADGGGVEWSASAGTFTSEGAGGGTDDFVAPAEVPPGGTVKITARLKDDPAVGDQRTIAIVPVPVPVASPEVQAPVKIATITGNSKKAAASVSRPRVMLLGRRLIMTTYVSEAGHVRLSAYLGHRRLGSCASLTPAKRTFTCRVTLARNVPAHSHIAVWASLRVGGHTVQMLRPAGVIAQMTMTHTGLFDAVKEGISGVLWCGQSL